MLGLLRQTSRPSSSLPHRCCAISMFSKRLESDRRTGPGSWGVCGNASFGVALQNPADLMRSSREKGTEKAADGPRASPMLPCRRVRRSFVLAALLALRRPLRPRAPRRRGPACPPRSPSTRRAVENGPRPQVRPRRPGHRDRRGRAQGDPAREARRVAFPRPPRTRCGRSSPSGSSRRRRTSSTGSSISTPIPGRSRSTTRSRGASSWSRARRRPCDGEALRGRRREAHLHPRADARAAGPEPGPRPPHEGR